MGYIRHHAIVVTGTDYIPMAGNPQGITPAQAKAVEIFGARNVSALLKSVMNGYHSFFVQPDGSKEGWADSDTGDRLRDEFVAWLDVQRYTDGSGPLDWVEVQYGDDELVTAVCRDSDALPRSKEAQRRKEQVV